MKLKYIVIGGIMLLCAVAGIVAIFTVHGPAGGDGDDDENPAQNGNSESTIVSVQVGSLTNITLHSYVHGYGTIQAAPAVTNQPAAGGALAAPSAGTVAKINVVAGQHVQKGTVLMVLNSATATFEYANAQLERQKKLFEQQNTSLKNVEDASAQLASLQVVAPVSGTVTSVNVQPGQSVDTTTTVAEVIDLDRLALSVKIPSAQAGQLQVGQETQITSEPPVTASLSWVGSTVDPADGAVPAVALLPANSGLRPGEFVQFKVVTETRTNCLAAPTESVVTDESGESALWLVNDNQATKTNVEIGLRDDGWVEITSSGFKAGDSVVTVGAYGLPDKTQIKNLNSSNETTNSSAAK
ncbi:MAG TPA: efflux RND transporter periplasmic adaptor subunit [Verrucomicrobiae bacterium]|jgi:membrane fusion protein (multidrug efflux system)|nr:efflux RND transporter periplasmic adaptor subunit [Verrucomicrobiae bacterium]